MRMTQIIIHVQRGKHRINLFDKVANPNGGNLPTSIVSLITDRYNRNNIKEAPTGKFGRATLAGQL